MSELQEGPGQIASTSTFVYDPDLDDMITELVEDYLEEEFVSFYKASFMEVAVGTVQAMVVASLDPGLISLSSDQLTKRPRSRRRIRRASTGTAKLTLQRNKANGALLLCILRLVCYPSRNWLRLAFAASIQCLVA
jgi:hypothetical protein